MNIGNVQVIQLTLALNKDKAPLSRVGIDPIEASLIVTKLKIEVSVVLSKVIAPQAS